MLKMMLKFSRKNDTTNQNYVALSCVRSIDDVFFDSDFSYDRFFVKSSVDTMNKLNEIVKRQKLCAAQNVSTSAISNATLTFRLFSHFDLSLCINSIFFRSINVNAILISNNIFDSSLTDFTHQICVDVVLDYKISQLAHVLDVISKTINFFRVKFIKKNRQSNRLIFNNNITRCCRFSLRWNCNDEMLLKHLSIRR